MTSVYQATYRSSDGSLYVDFDFCKMEDGGYRIYILSDINYCGRAESSPDTHRIITSPYSYICWDGKISSLKQAKAVAALWADTTALYIKGYTDFDTIARILSA